MRLMLGVVLWVTFVVASVGALGQSQPNLENGYKPYGSYDAGQIDTVNLMNGNLILNIPAPFDYAQRGKFTPKYAFYLTSKNWTVQCVPDTQVSTGLDCQWTPGAAADCVMPFQNVGSNTELCAFPTGVTLTNSLDLTVKRTAEKDVTGDGPVLYDAYGYSLVTWDLAVHSLHAAPLGFESMDGSGYRVVMSNPDSTGVMNSVTVTDRAGNQWQGSFPSPSSCITGVYPAYPTGIQPVPDGGGTYAPIATGNGGNDYYCGQLATFSTFTEANGNVFNLNTGADTMGRAFPTVPNSTDTSNCVSPLPIHGTLSAGYYGPNNAVNTIKFCYSSFPVQTNFSQPYVTQAQGHPSPGLSATTNLYLVATIVLPDQSKWTFNYDTYGEVTYIGLPLGGSISYTWTEVAFQNCSPTDQTAVSRAVTSRTVTDNNGNSYVWHYQWGTETNNTLTNTVTDPLGNDSVHTFTSLTSLGGSIGGCDLYETTTQYYQGSGSARTLLREVDTAYSGAAVGDDTGIDPLGNVFATDITTTVYPSGKVSKVHRKPDPGLGANQPIFGNVAQELEYDWGQGASGPLLRETDTTYQWQANGSYLTANMADLPASVVVKDGSGCSLAETDYTYDESSYLTSYQNTVGPLPTGTFVSPPNSVRGNPSTVKKWLAPANSCNPTGGMPIVTHANWYDTGEVHLQIDALNRTTTHSYDPAYAGAYSTQTCSPTTNGGATTHCVSGTYDLLTGLLTSFTNENATQQASGNTPGDSAHTTFYSYDLMWRAIKGTAPPDPNNNNAQAVTQIAYPVPVTLPFVVTHTSSVTASTSDSVTTTYDGLGRVYKTQHPLPNGTAEVDTTYDGLGHVTSVTNPYFSTSDPTYGTVETAYDALGRATQVTEQDGSIRYAFYDAFPQVTTTDESGRQRRTTTDALGRLIEVEEPPAAAPPASASATITLNGWLQAFQSSAPPSAVAGSGLAGFIDSSSGQHWAYLGPNQHVYNLYWNAGSYGYSDVTAGAGGPSAAGTAVTGFPDGSQQWADFDSNGHIDNYYWSGSYGYQDATGSSGAPAASAGSPLIGFADSGGGQHWAYFGTNHHVYNIYWSGGYGAGDPTASSGAPAAAMGSALTAFADSNGGQHWAYLGSNGHLYSISWSASTNYTFADVTSLAAAPAATPGSALAGFSDRSGGLHWAYLDSNGHIYNLYYANGYGYADVTAATGAPAAASGSAVAGFIDTSGGQHWAYLGTNNHVYNFSWQGSYGYADTTAAAGGPPAQAGSAITAFEDLSGGQHWAYFGANGHVYNFWWSNGAYGYQDVNASTDMVFDAGTVSLQAGSFTATVCYGQSTNPACAGQAVNSSSAQVATALAQALNVSSSPVTATASGSTLTLIWKTAGGTSATISALSTVHDNSSAFPNPSFTSQAESFAMGAPTTLTNPYITQYSYDGLGNLVTVTQKGDPTVTPSSQWRVRNFTYDTLGRLLTAQNPESGTITYTYDANSNLLQKTSPAANQTGSTAQLISYCYDELNRLTDKSYTAQAPVVAPPCTLSGVVVHETYDQGANAKGRLSSLTDLAGSASYTYDVLGRMATEQRVITGVTKNMSYGYNLDSSLKTLTYPSGATVTYTVDSAGRDVSAVDSGNGINYATAAAYGPDSSLTGFVSGNSGSFAGITNSFSYNKRLQPVNMSASAPSATVFSIGYDFHLANGDNGNVYGITNYRDNSRNQSFTYDSLNRLVSAQNAGTNCAATTVNGKTEYWGNSYSYDAWGNLLQKSVTKCNAENLLVTALPNNQLSGYGYDDAGNMTWDPTDQVRATYDQENRIAAATKNSETTSYTYDADGNRVRKSNISTTLYWYMSPGIVAESDPGGNLQSEYVFFDGERVARKDFPSGAVSYYFSDHLKTASVITDASGNIKEDEDYYPWGGELQFVNNDSNHYKFTGKERDGETGLDDLGARYYSNGLGRFITPDWAAKATAVPYAEFADPQSLNLYSYVRNIPTTKVDPDGHQGDEPDLVEMFKGGLNRLKAMAVETAVSVINAGGNPDFQFKVDTGAFAPQNEDQWLGGVYTEAATWAAPIVGEQLVAERAVVQITESAGEVVDTVRAAGETGTRAGAEEAPAAYNRSEHYGNPATSKAATEIRTAGEGQPCPSCGQAMKSGTKTAPTAQHTPTLKSHYYSGGHKMTPAQRRAYARSPKSMEKGAVCKTCQSKQGKAESQK